MVYSPSLRGPSGLQSGWVSLPEQKSIASKASKSFVGSASRDPDGDEKMDPGSQPGSIEEERKVRLTALLSMSKGTPGSAGTASSLPPKLELTPTFNKTFRFKCTASSQVAVTVTDMLLACGAIAQTTSTVAGIASSVRVLRVKAWPSVSSAVGEIFLEWQGPIAGIERDTQMNREMPSGITFTRAVSFVPPKNTFCSDWMSSAISPAIFTMASPAGTIVDVDLEFTLSNALNGVAGTSVVGGLTVGKLYFGALDGQTSGIYTPVGLLWID